MATGPSHPPLRKTYDLEIAIVSAKHLKNVHWLHGDLKPYVIFWVDLDQRRATQSDDSGNTRPVWNERFILHLTQSPHDTVVTFEIFHSKSSKTLKPLVGTLRVPLKEVINIDDFDKLRTFELRRPSGRPHGKIRLKLAIRESRIHDYQITPPSSYYYSAATSSLPSYRTYPSYPLPIPSPPPPHSLHSYSYKGGRGCFDSYSSYYPGYYSQPPPLPPPPPPRPLGERQSSYYGGLESKPSAPVDYSPPPPPYDPHCNGKMGVGTGVAAGAVAGALGGLTLGEGLKYEERKIAERVKNSRAASRDDYSNYSVEY